MIGATPTETHTGAFIMVHCHLCRQRHPGLKPRCPIHHHYFCAVFVRRIIRTAIMAQGMSCSWTQAALR